MTLFLDLNVDAQHTIFCFLEISQILKLHRICKTLYKTFSEIFWRAYCLTKHIKTKGVNETWKQHYIASVICSFNIFGMNLSISEQNKKLTYVLPTDHHRISFTKNSRSRWSVARSKYPFQPNRKMLFFIKIL